MATNIKSLIEIKSLRQHEQVEYITTLVWNETLEAVNLGEPFDYHGTLEFIGFCVTKMLIPKQDREGL